MNGSVLFWDHSAPQQAAPGGQSWASAWILEVKSQHLNGKDLPQLCSQEIWCLLGAAAKLGSPGCRGKAGPQGATAKPARRRNFFPRAAAVVSPTASLPGAGEYLKPRYSGCKSVSPILCLPSHATVAPGQHVPPQRKVTMLWVELPSQPCSSAGAATGQDLGLNVAVPALGLHLWFCPPGLLILWSGCGTLPSAGASLSLSWMGLGFLASAGLARGGRILLVPSQRGSVSGQDEPLAAGWAVGRAARFEGPQCPTCTPPDPSRCFSFVSTTSAGMTHFRQKMCFLCSQATEILTYIIRSILTLPESRCDADPREWCRGTEMDVQSWEWWMDGRLAGGWQRKRKLISVHWLTTS